MAGARSRRFSRRGLMRAGGAGAAGVAALGVGGCLGDGDEEGAPDVPNVLLVVTDSTRRDFVGAYGGDRLAKTPNIDALAGEGLRFDHAVPEAMPTVPVRRALLTGMRSYPFRDWQVAPQLPPFPGWNPIPASRQLFPELMTQAGIETAYVTDNPFLIGPRFARARRTFDTSRPVYLQGEYRIWNTPLKKGRLASKKQIANYLLPALEGTEAEQRLREHEAVNAGRDPENLSGSRVVRTGMGLLDSLKDRQPFFLGVDAFDPHEAFDPPTTFVRRSAGDGVEPIIPFETPFSKVEQVDATDEQVQRIRELYAGELTYIDAEIGRLLNKLDDLGLAENTVVYYLSDHGILLGEHGILGKANDMLGSEIHRVPYVIRHPEGKRSGETSEYFASTHDVAPTMLSFQGITRPGQMDGEDLSVMFDGKAPPPRGHWTTCYANHVAAGDGRYVLIADNQGEKKRLYDTDTDPEEVDDIAATNAEIVESLWRSLLDQAGGTMPVFGPKGVVRG